MLRKYRQVLVLFLKVLERLQEFRYNLTNLHLSYTKKHLRIIYVIFGLISCISLTIEFGFYYPKDWANSIRLINNTVINFLLFYELISLICNHETLFTYVLKHKLEMIILILVILQKLFEREIIQILNLGEFGADDTVLIFLSINQFFLLFSNLAKLFRNTRIYNLKKLNPSLVFFLSFLSISIIGTALLFLPKAHKVDLKFVDVFFTVISATCVTGLSTIDIFQSFTYFGLGIILFLIQIGGLGLITLTTFFSIFLTGRASVNDTMVMKDLLSEEALGKVGSIIKSITIQTFFIELFGAILLYYFFPDEINITNKDKIFFSIFHAISAFCNAGFSLFPNNLMGIKNNFFLTVIMLLITFGGFSFPVVNEIYKKIFTSSKTNFKFSIFSKLVIITSLVLIISGAISYFILEKNFTLKNLSLGDKIFHSIFYSISLRTAGFNTLSISEMGIPMVFFSFLFMWIGASPNSTGGGIKTSTFAVSLLHILDIVKGRERLEIFNRQISVASVSRAQTTIVLSLFVIFICIFGLTLTENFSFIDIAYESVSAFGTVGLSRGITGSLSDSGKYILSIVMFMGRVGILTILIALTPKSKSFKHSYPTEYVVVG